MPDDRPSDADSETGGSGRTHPRFFSRSADMFILALALFYALAAMAMTAISLGLITISIIRLTTAFRSLGTGESILLDAVSSLVISVAVLDVAKYVMEEEVLRSRELHRPDEARQAVTKFMVIIALVVSIEGIVLVFELGRSEPELLLYPILLLCVSVVIVVGLGVFQRLSLGSEKKLRNGARDDTPPD